MPPRLIADALMIALASDWTKRLERQFGSGCVVSTWHGAERLFEPILPNGPPPSYPGFAIKKARFIEDFGHLDLVSRAFLEVRLPPECRADSGLNSLAAYMSCLDDGLRPLGMYASSRPDLDPHLSEIVFRFFSPTVLELGLYVFLGINAPKLCLAGGLVPPRTVNGLHKAGFHAVGIPMRRVEPLAAAWRDLCHAAYWATHETPYQRIAATLLYESACRTLNGEKKIREVGLGLGRLVDLELSANGGVIGIMEGLRGVLPPHRFLALMGDFQERLDKLSGTTGETEVSEMRAQIAPWLLPQL